jgi:hypothetical protein
MAPGGSRSTWRDHTCYHAVEAHRQGSTPLTAVLELVASEADSPVVAVTHSELSRDLRTAVGQLPAAQRDAVRVFYLDGLNHALPPPDEAAYERDRPLLRLLWADLAVNPRLPGA